MPSEKRRFPPPWSVTDSGGAWLVKDKNGVPISWHYYREVPSQALPDALTREEAYAMAVNFARIPHLLGKA
jgi:hypothetical protein